MKNRLCSVVIMCVKQIEKVCNQNPIQVVPFTCPVTADSNKKICFVSSPVSQVVRERLQRLFLFLLARHRARRRSGDYEHI
jgi:hypothetical protein